MANFKPLVSFMVYLLYLMTLTRVDGGVTLEYNILEEESTNYTIAYIANETSVSSQFSPDVFETLTYTILSRNSPYLENLNLDKATGVLKVKKPLDRDKICHDNQVCEISIDLATQPMEHMEIITVKLKVWDINDNAPQFDEQEVTVEVAEGIEGTSYPLPPAYDPDFGYNSIEDYRLVPDSDEFTLQVLDNPDGSDDFHLTLVKSLDRETVDHYNLELLVWDGGDPSLTGTLTINIKVLDTNDNQPIFTQSTYHVSVRENISKGSTLIQVEAIDFDHSVNGEVFYHFTTSTNTAYGRIFDINEDTGEIYTIGTLDYEERSVYYLSVAASDRAANSFTAYAKVIINITDQNDSPPIITINGLGDSGGVEIPENSPKGTFVAHLRVHDPDSEQNGRLSCSISSLSFVLEELDDSEYKMVTEVPLDRESMDEYHVTLVCQDYGHPPQKAEEVIQVVVTDVNDHWPQFESSYYEKNVLEGTGTNNALLKVTAYDEDIDENADITYSIQELTGYDGGVKHSENLMVHAKGGSIFITKSFDREKQDLYSYLVTATDSGSPALSSNATVVLHILDINDEIPQFVMPHFKFGTYENQKVGTEIGVINATDHDLAPNNVIYYALKLSTEDSNTFEINSTTGKITTKKILDREAVYEYHLVVKAMNIGSSLSSTANVTVYVVDKNDNAPHITFPHRNNNSVKLNSTTAKGSTVATILAQDADQGQNAALVYAITGGNKDEYFEINMYGEIFLLQKLNVPNGITVFNLDITVSDRGKDALSSTQKLKLIVNGTLPVGKDMKPLLNLSGTTNIIIVALCSTVTIIIFTVILLFILFMMRRKKDHHRHRAAPERRNSSTCMEATKALLSMGTPGGGQVPPGSDASTLDFSKGELRTCEPPAPGQDSLDSGVDFTGDRSPHQVPHSEVVILAKDGHHKGIKGSIQKTDPALMETHSTFLSMPYSKGGIKSSQELYQQQPHPVTSDVTDGPCNMREIQLRVHDMLYNSTHTSPHDDSSASDSGKGPSEEGDHVRENPEELEMADFRFPTHYGSLQHSSALSLPSREDSWNAETSHQPNPYRIPTTFSQPTPPQKVGHHPPTSQTGARHSGKPILKFSQQDTIAEGNEENYQQNRPFQNMADGQKKVVHFVRPYSSGRDQQGELPCGDDPKITNCETNDLNKPGYIYCPSPKATQRLLSCGGSNENFNANNNTVANHIIPEYANNKTQGGGYYSPPKYPPTQSKYFDIWRHSLDASRRDDQDSQDGFSDGETTTSGSYCMDNGSINEDTVLTVEGIHNKHIFV